MLQNLSTDFEFDFLIQEPVKRIQGTDLFFRGKDSRFFREKAVWSTVECLRLFRGLIGFRKTALEKMNVGEFISTYLLFRRDEGPHDMSLFPVEELMRIIGSRGRIFIRGPFLEGETFPIAGRIGRALLQTSADDFPCRSGRFPAIHRRRS